MTDRSDSIKRQNLFGVDFALMDYESASDIIVENAESNKSFGVSALAVHGLVTAVKDPGIARAIEKIDMVVPDGQPIRWALNRFCGAGLEDRVYGPELTLRVLEKANRKGLRIYLFGSTEDTLEKLSGFIKSRYQNVILAGMHPDRFREATHEEDQRDINKINDTGPHIVLVGRGCPRQEVWVADHLGKIKAVMMAVGAAFDIHAGSLKQAPKWMQDRGLEWFYRLVKEPRRLWKRYLLTNSYFVYLILQHILFSKNE
jgi:exopolysaccharide biosynthesis WecB/TagA/CpsF family protein